MRRLKWWCAQARQVDMQWAHVFMVDTLCPPADDVLEGMRIDVGPVEPVLTDEEAYAARSSNAASSSQQAGRGAKRSRPSAGAD